jgi:TRAP-type C4-dicarboxylate transport system substrate-binding protein
LEESGKSRITDTYKRSFQRIERRKKMKRERFWKLLGIFSFILTTTIFFATAAPAEKDKPIHLNFAAIFPPTGSPAQGIEWWVKEVNKRTEEAVNIKVHWGGTLARSMEMAEAVRTGTADIGDTVWSPYFPEKFALHSIGDHPVPFIDKPLASWLAAEEVSKEFPEFEKELAANNMKRLTYWGVGNVHIISRKPIRKMEDLKGLKVRCSGKLHPVQLKAVGAVPIFIPSVEAFDALQKGVIDASTCTGRWAIDYKYFEAAKYFTKIGMGGDPGQGAMINLDVWNKLPQRTQEVLLKLRDEYPIVYEELDYQETEKAYKTFRKTGVQIIDFPRADLETWKKLPQMNTLSTDWIKFVVEKRGLPESRVSEILRRYKELLEKFSKQYPREY